METTPPAGGISTVNRERLTALTRHAAGPFTVGEAASILDMDDTRAGKLLADLTTRGWLTRVRRNLYTTAPLDALDPSSWREDPWVVAAKTFAPCYIGGWSACEHWGLTDQLFRDVVVISGRRVRHRRPIIQGTRFHVKAVLPAKLFGARTVWRNQVRVAVSDPARTLVDLLDDPRLGGGMRHVAEVVDAYFESELRDDCLLIEYVERFGNRAVYKRLGYLVETLALEAPGLVSSCLERVSAGFSLLDPWLPDRGSYLRRWNLRLNTRVTMRAEPQ